MYRAEWPSIATIPWWSRYNTDQFSSSLRHRKHSSSSHLHTGIRWLNPVTISGPTGVAASLLHRNSRIRIQDSNSSIQLPVIKSTSYKHFTTTFSIGRMSSYRHKDGVTLYDYFGNVFRMFIHPFRDSTFKYKLDDFFQWTFFKLFKERSIPSQALSPKYYRESLTRPMLFFFAETAMHITHVILMSYLIKTTSSHHQSQRSTV